MQFLHFVRILICQFVTGHVLFVNFFCLSKIYTLSLMQTIFCIISKLMVYKVPHNQQYCINDNNTNKNKAQTQQKLPQYKVGHIC